MLLTNNDLLRIAQEAINLLQQQPPFSNEELEQRKQAIKVLRPIIEPWKKKLKVTQYTKTLSNIAQETQKPKISSDQAWQLGYICLREAPKTAPIPGLWILPKDLTIILSQVSEWQIAKTQKEIQLGEKKLAKIQQLLNQYSDLSGIDLNILYKQLQDTTLTDLPRAVEVSIFEQFASLAVANLTGVIFKQQTYSYQVSINSQEIIETAYSSMLTFSLVIPDSIKPIILERRFDLVADWIKEKTQDWIKESSAQIIQQQQEITSLSKLLGINLNINFHNKKIDNYLNGISSELKHKWKTAVEKQLTDYGLVTEFSKNTLTVKAFKVSRKIMVAGQPLSIKFPLELPKVYRANIPFYQDTPLEYAEEVVSLVKTNCLDLINQELSLLNNIEIDEPDFEEIKPYYKQNTLLSNLGNLFHKINSNRKAVSISKVLEQVNEIKQRCYQQAKILLQAKEAERITRIGSYAEHFQLARNMFRRFTLLVGPTNSGKTFQALNLLAQAQTGCYLAPLRLLALEGQEALLQRGCLTSFLTGEERDLRENASHIAATIEMLDTLEPIEVAVIDEAQMLFDKDRGWAWTTAIFGVPAKHVVMTGAPSCIKMIQHIAEYLNEPLEIIECKRFTEMEVLSKPAKLTELEPATAIIAFSRRDVLGLKAQLEVLGKTVSVIYGNLSPQVRREEALRFRNGESEIVVATDAIGMGLNLPIKTLLFWTTEKWDGQETRELNSEEIRQIAGRAGRYGLFEKAFIGAFNQRSLKTIEQSLKLPIPNLTAPCQVMPGISLVAEIGKVIETNALSKILKFFREKMLIKSTLLCSARMEAVISLAEKTDVYFSLPLEDRLIFSCAPIDIRDAIIVKHWQTWLNGYNHNKTNSLSNLPRQFTHNNSVAQNQNDLEEAERLTKILTCYSWLSYRFPANFPDLIGCDEQREILNQFIERSLRKKGLRKLCRHCGKALSPLYQYATCENCHRNRYSGYEDEDFY